MEMEIKVRNFRGARSVDLRVDKITLVAGDNGVGKSSCCQAVAAALTRSPVPFFKSAKPESALVTKGNAGCLVTEGEERGGVMLREGEGTVQIGWPKLSMETQGEPPMIGKVAAGLVTPVEMEDADRSQFYSRLLSTQPTREDLVRALKDSGLSEEAVVKYDAQIWDAVEISGFDAVYKSARESLTKLKGAWEGHTGERWGDNKAANYAPAGWNQDLAAETVDSHAERVADAKQKVETAIATAALSEAELDKLSADGAREDQAKMLLERANSGKAAAETKVNDLRNSLEAETSEQAFTCAHCGGVNNVKFEGAEVEVTPSEKTDAEMAESRERIAKAKATLKVAEKALADAVGTVAKAKADYNTYIGSNVKLESARKKKGSREDLDMARDYLSGIEKNHKALEQKLGADNIYRRAVELQTVIGILAPEGLRQEILVKKLAEFNQVLASLCVASKFGQVQLSDELETSYDGRPYFLASESEKWRCRTVVAIAVAIKTGEKLVILDGADIMGLKGRNGLFAMLVGLNKDMGFRALVGMTVSKRDLVPDLDGKGIGNTYWIEGGKVVK